MVSSPAPVGFSTDRPLTVVYRSAASLVPDPRNARTHPRRQIEQIVASIRAFGFTNPILADPAGKLIAGHGRLLAARQLGLAEVPVITLAGLSDAQQRALRLADNKIALGAGWDIEILKLELAELSLPEFDIDLGSGTSLIAAERVGRRFRGLDIDPAYVDVAIERWEKLTGQSATLVQRKSGETEQ